MTQLKPTVQGAAHPTASMLIAVAVAAAGCATHLGDQGRAPVPAAREAAPARPVPTRTGYADLPGARIHYQVHGDLNAHKAPLLILHGSYLSADAMAPLIRSLAPTRTIIATDARGPGRNGDVPGPLTYELLADDAAGVLKTLNVAKADVLGYSMGANTALLMAMRHPDRVGKLVVLSGTYRRDGWYPEVLKALESVTPESFAGTPLEAEYRRLSPTPNAFPALVGKMKTLDALPQAWPEPAIRAIAGKTMIIIGDADGVELEHAVKLFKLRGGGDVEAAEKGFLDKVPRARLAILPATSHIGIMGRANLIADLATPFLDDVTPAIPPGFLPEGNAPAPQRQAR
jgi:pimeloyl-ACP methyl ester carboxylesterase